jgi:phosphoribosylanthranilate isomerase
MLKICGITDLDFACAAAEGGVDYLGFIFSSKSPRGLTPTRAAEIVSAVRRGHFIPRMVGVFTLRPVADVLRVADEVGFDVVQLHGRFSPEDVAAVKASGREVWLLDDGGDPCATAADGILIDGVKGNLVGGTGERSDWSRVAVVQAAGKKAILAGGLSAVNIAAARATGADVLDVNSSLEISPGVKSLDLLATLLRKRNEIT